MTGGLDNSQKINPTNNLKGRKYISQLITRLPDYQIKGRRSSRKINGHSPRQITDSYYRGKSFKKS